MKHTLCAALATAFLLGAAPISSADEIKVLASNGLKAVLTEVAPQFERESGHTLIISFGASSLIAKQIEEGERFDVAILTPALIASLVSEGKVADGSSLNIARVGLGVAVKRGAPKPDISTVDAFRQTLLNARSVAYTTAGQSGQHFVSVIERLGIAEQVKAKGKTIPAGDAGELIAKGEADTAVQLISELGSVPGIEIVGPFPQELQSYVVLAGGVGAGARNKDGAQALLKFLTTPAATSIMKAKGMEP